MIVIAFDKKLHMNDIFPLGYACNLFANGSANIAIGTIIIIIICIIMMVWAVSMSGILYIQCVRNNM